MTQPPYDQLSDRLLLAPAASGPQVLGAALDTWSIPQLLKMLARVEDELRRCRGAESKAADRLRLETRAEELIAQIRAR